MELINEFDSFNSCAGGIIPVFEDLSMGDMHAVRWTNFQKEEKYASCFSDEILKYGEQIDGRRNIKVLLINGTYDQNLKSSMLLLRRYQAACDAQNGASDPDHVPSAPIFDLRRGAFTTLDRHLKELSQRMDHTGGWIISALPAKNDEETDFTPVFNFLCQDFNFNVFICVSQEEYETEAVQRLIYEGGYDTLFLPKEDIAGVIKRANSLFVEPAVRNSVTLYPGNWVKVEENFFDDNPYLFEQGVTQVDEAVKQLMKLRGKFFRECDLITLFEMAYQKNITILQALHWKTEETYDDLMKGNDFAVVKNLAQKRVAILKAARTNPRLGDNGQNLLFVGNPGTGKTEGSTLFYKLLQAAGCVNGKFVIATRSDIVGSYVGQTSPKVKKLFDEARDGLLFVDEAGFLLQKNTGGFVQEAIKEFTRYMSTRRDVSVIFAVYPDEQEAFLALDPGLSSRINHIVKFEDMTNERLFEIGESMLAAKGYFFGEGYKQLLLDYIERVKKSAPDSFGNGREVRRIIEAAIQETEYRMATNGEEHTGEFTEVSLADLKQAIDEMLKTSKKEEPASIGFCANLNNKITVDYAS